MTIQSILIWLFQTFYKRFIVGENYEEKSHFQALWLYTCLKGIFMVIYINDCYSLPKVELEQNCAGLQYSVDLDWSIDLVVEEQPQMVTHVHIWIGDSKLYGEGCIN